MFKLIGPILSSLIKPKKAIFYPITINYEITSQCNLNCVMCRRDEFYKQNYHMDFKTFKKVFDQTKPKFVALHGYGEPLLNSDLPKMIAYAKKSKSKTTITSNLTALNKKTAKDITDNKLNLLKISLDSTKQDIYQKIRGADKFHRVIDNIKLMVKTKQNQKSQHPEVRINFTIMKYNYQEITEIIKLAYSLGIKTIFFQTLLFKEAFFKEDKELADLRHSDLLTELNKGLTTAKQLNCQTNIAELIKDLPYLWYGYSKRDTFARSNSRRCLKPWISSFVSASGDIKPCDCLGLTNVVMGNVYQQSFKEIWNSKAYQEFRQEIKKHQRPHPVCQDCFPLSYFDFARYSKLAKKYLS